MSTCANVLTVLFDSLFLQTNPLEGEQKSMFLGIVHNRIETKEKETFPPNSTFLSVASQLLPLGSLKFSPRVSVRV